MAQRDRKQKHPPASSGAASKSAAGAVPRGNPMLWAAAVLIAYLGALLFRSDRIPAGLNNDVAEEALRGLYLVNGGHFEVITFAIGNSAETLYLYLMGAALRLLGPTTFALHLLSWIFAIACIWMIWKLAERITDGLPAWIPLLTAACSIWLFHYARTGLRAISAPFFLCAFALLLDRAERRPADRGAGLICGAVLGLGIYGYTSARVLPIAFVLYVAYRMVRENGSRAALVRRYVPIAAGALVISIPNVIFFLQQPAAFLSRGSYVLTASGSARITNVLWTALFPFYYPDTYRSFLGPYHYFDGVSAGLTDSGFNPVHIIFAAAFLFGLYGARRHFDRPVTIFLLAAWATSVAALGIAGPSLTRLLLVLPVILVFAAVGFDQLRRLHSKLWIAVLILILFVGVSDGYPYLSGKGEAPAYYAASATAIGQRAAALAGQGRRVLCIVSRDASVLRLLTHGMEGRVKIAEFYQRPLNPGELPFNEFRPDVLLVENAPVFREFTAGVPAGSRVVEERFTSITIAVR
jgi:hypothetical protein